jgi:magnesium chelatase family protein
VRARVVEARDRQLERYRDTEWTCNAHLPGPLARRQASLTGAAEHLLGDAVDASALSGRGFDRVIKVARTIADLDGASRVDVGHIAEALSYREAFEAEERSARAS